MPAETVEFFYDYVDPASYLVDRILATLDADADLSLVPRPFEIQPPPGAVVDAEDPGWKGYLQEVWETAGEEGVDMVRPAFVPWSRKAHELAIEARRKERFPRIHDALFRAYFVEGRDIGRVDVLVELAAEAGMDRGETKAVLDVDRNAGTVEAERERAERLEVRGVPTLLAGERRLEGFHPRREILTFLVP